GTVFKVQGGVGSGGSGKSQASIREPDIADCRARITADTETRLVEYAGEVRVEVKDAAVRDRAGQALRAEAGALSCARTRGRWRLGPRHEEDRIGLDADIS